MSGFTFGVHVEGRIGGLKRAVASVGGCFLAVVGAAAVGAGRLGTEERLDGPISTHHVDVEALRTREHSDCLIPSHDREKVE